MNGWRKVAVSVLCLILVGFAACMPFGGGNEEEVTYQLVEVVRGDITVSITVDGNLSLLRYSKLAFGAGGTVAEVNVEQGDEVTEGQALAKLDTSSLELAVAQAQLARSQAQAAFAQAQAALEQADYNLKLVKPKFPSSSDTVKIAESQVKAAELQLEMTELQLEVAELALAQAQKQLDKATITAPFDGVIARVSVDEGETVSSATTIIHLIDPSSMELNVNVDEVDIPDVKLGQRANISVDALPDMQFEGRVSSICPLPTGEAGLVLYEVKISFDAPEGSELKAGMSATVDIIISQRGDVLLVPNRAIKQDNQGNSMVRVMVNDQIEDRAVVTGLSDGFYTEIMDGLDEGEKVVIEIRAKPESPGFFFQQ